MDAGRPACKTRICLTYLFTLSILAIFFYHLLWNSRKNLLEVSRLKEDISFLSETLQQQQQHCTENRERYDQITGDPAASKGPSAGGACDSRELNAQMETLFKSKIGTLMDDFYNLKKQVMTSGCAFQGNSPETNNEAMALSTMRINYASEELGASIINVLAKPIGEVNFIRKMLGLGFMANPPINMLRSNLLPGSCFGFEGSNATVSLHLAKTIIVEEFSLTHVPKEMTPSRCVDNAPKDFEVYGLPSGNYNKELLGQWTYENAPNKRTQSFLCKNTGSFQSLLITFNSNHGANSTCIYRIEVYGKLP